MAASTLHQASVGTFLHVLGVLEGLLGKGAAHAVSAGFPSENLLNARLAPDMLPLTRQVQIVCDLCKGGTARIAAVEIPVHADEEQNIDALIERIGRVRDFIQSVDASAIEAGDARPIELKVRDRTLAFASGSEFLHRWSLPNLYFHLSLAYALLRHNGVPLGKLDYLQAPAQPPVSAGA